MQFNVRTDEIKAYSRKLETLHRSAFPSAVRATLNGAAFDVKKKTLIDSSEKNFVNRQPNFFKANSRVSPAKGFNVNTMEAVVGMVSLKGTNKAVDDLEQQEHGGVIKGRSFIAMKPGRIANSTNKNVRKQNRISGINKMVVASRAQGTSEKQRFVKSVVFAGVGGHVLSERGVVWRINSMKRNKGKWQFKMTPIHSFEKNRSVQVKATHFMEEAAVASAKKMPYIYKREAEFQFKKHLG